MSKGYFISETAPNEELKKKNEEHATRAEKIPKATSWKMFQYVSLCA